MNGSFVDGAHGGPSSLFVVIQQASRDGSTPPQQELPPMNSSMASLARQSLVSLINHCSIPGLASDSRLVPNAFQVICQLGHHNVGVSRGSRGTILNVESALSPTSVGCRKHTSPTRIACLVLQTMTPRSCARPVCSLSITFPE